MRKTILVAIASLVTAGCGGNNDKSTGTTTWGDLGISLGGGGDMTGLMSGPDMAVYTPKLPFKLTPLTNANTATVDISLYFAVTDANNRGVPNLSCGGGGGQPDCSKNFNDLEDGIAVDPNESFLQVEALSGNSLDIPTVLVLDLSGNIVANGNLPKLQTAAKAIISHMTTEQTMAILAFADQPSLRINFTNKQADLNKAIDDLSSANLGVSSDLFGAVVQALGMWQDGFSTNGATKLTAGMVIVVASGEDMSGIKKYEDVIAAASNGGNKRIITVGVGACGAFGNVNTLAGMAGCGTGGGDMGTGTSSCSQSCGGYFAFNTYTDLVNDVTEVTDAIKNFAHSIYKADYCSPKRSGSTTTHNAVFYPVGNSPNLVSAACTPATFNSSAVSQCASFGNGTDTQVCQQSGMTICCPPDQPYWCPPTADHPTGQCFASAADAQSGLPNYPGCGMTCVQCGGSGTPMTTGTNLQPGPAIHLTFTANGYATNQCPHFWAQNCKDALSPTGCCAMGIADPTAVPSPSGGGPFGQQCVTAFNMALGDTAVCTTDAAKFCPTLGPNCTALATCCSGYSQPQQQALRDQCYGALYGTYSNPSTMESQCGTASTGFNNLYCPAAGSACDTLKTCCGTLGPGGQSTCYNQMVNNPASCATLAPEYCPPSATESNCVSFATCCTAFAANAGSNCYSDLLQMDSTGTPATNQSNCGSSSFVGQYCPTMPNCTKLQKCCSTKPATATPGDVTRDQCESTLVNSNNNDSSCMSYLASNHC